MAGSRLSRVPGSHAPQRRQLIRTYPANANLPQRTCPWKSALEPIWELRSTGQIPAGTPSSTVRAAQRKRHSQRFGEPTTDHSRSGLLRIPSARGRSGYVCRLASAPRTPIPSITEHTDPSRALVAARATGPSASDVKLSPWTRAVFSRRWDLPAARHARASIGCGVDKARKAHPLACGMPRQRFRTTRESATTLDLHHGWLRRVRHAAGLDAGSLPCLRPPPGRS
jgi:hypothetical protein